MISLNSFESILIENFVDGLGMVDFWHERQLLMSWHIHSSTEDFQRLFRSINILKSENEAWPNTCLWTLSIIILISFHGLFGSGLPLSAEIEFCSLVWENLSIGIYERNSSLDYFIESFSPELPVQNTRGLGFDMLNVNLCSYISSYYPLWWSTQKNMSDTYETITIWVGCQCNSCSCTTTEPNTFLY